MATERRELSKSEADARMARIFKLICVGSLAGFLTVGCANMKTDKAEEAEPAVAKQAEPVQDAKAVEAAEQMVASLAKPTNVEAPSPVVKVEPKPEQKPAPVAKPAPVVKVEPKPEPAPIVKVEPKPEPAPVAKVVPKPEPVAKVEPKPEPVPVAKVEPKPQPVKPSAADDADDGEATAARSVVLEKTATKVVKTSKLNSAVARELPVRFDVWLIDEGRGPYDEPLVLTTPSWQMGNDRAAAQVSVTLMEGKLLVNSTSDIANKKGESGIRINGGQWVPFTDVTNDNVGVVAGDWLSKLDNGGKLEIRMGFFPTLYKNPQQFESEVSLNDMRTAIPRYKRLLKQVAP